LLHRTKLTSSFSNPCCSVSYAFGLARTSSPPFVHHTSTAVKAKPLRRSNPSPLLQISPPGPSILPLFQVPHAYEGSRSTIITAARQLVPVAAAHKSTPTGAHSRSSPYQHSTHSSSSCRVSIIFATCFTRRRRLLHQSGEQNTEQVTIPTDPSQLGNEYHLNAKFNQVFFSPTS
jgi:hypothetical protein